MTEPEQRPTPTDSGHGTGGGVRADEAREGGETPDTAGTAGTNPADAPSGGVSGRPAEDAPATRQPGDGSRQPAGSSDAEDNAEDNPFAPPPEDAHAGRSAPGQPQQSPWGPPPANPYGKVRPGPVQPWGSQRPREPERPHGAWGDPNRYGPVDQRPDPRDDPDRRYRDQREAAPQRPQRDLKTRWALGLSLGSTACTMLAIYQGLATFPAWMVGAAAGLAFAVAAFVLSISAQRTAALKRQRASEATASMVSASVSGVLAGLLLVASIVWWTPFKEYARCMQGANTQVAEKACLTQLEGRTGMSTTH
ncbi:hypothetical protein [Catenulispora subtropica]|uniref:DUF4190 domain-containing protein n=1 Tax=Catenulispora subtropica TaxID=450798 RepID=A0ABN2RZ10_9ACTN